MSRVIFLLPLFTFWALTALTVSSKTRRERMRGRDGGAWLLDLAGLLMQGVGIPVLESLLVVGGLAAFFPHAAGTFALPPLVAFVLNFVVVDYLYYWNHRLLHTRPLWPLHRVHHSLDRMDVVGTSRNTLWSSLFIVYVWVNGAAVFFLQDPSFFVLGAALTASLDLWRHSDLGPARDSKLYALLSYVLILPSDHRWHHTDSDEHGNYGANLSWWDRLHGTFVTSQEESPGVGVETDLPLWRKLAWPFEKVAP